MSRLPCTYSSFKLEVSSAIHTLSIVSNSYEPFNPVGDHRNYLTQKEALDHVGPEDCAAGPTIGPARVSGESAGLDWSPGFFVLQETKAPYQGSWFPEKVNIENGLGSLKSGI